jgi:hypothetical protein
MHQCSPVAASNCHGKHIDRHRNSSGHHSFPCAHSNEPVNRIVLTPKLPFILHVDEIVMTDIREGSATQHVQGKSYRFVFSRT